VKEHDVVEKHTLGSTNAITVKFPYNDFGYNDGVSSVPAEWSVSSAMCSHHTNLSYRVGRQWR